MDGDLVAALVLSGPLSLVICVSIIAIRREHPHHVHNLWYIFFLTVICYSALLVYLFDVAAYDSSFWEIFILYTKFAADIKGELYLVTGIVIIGILPQVMSFIISGIFGCGSPPMLVSTITKIAMFSLIKFFCILAGLTAGTGIVLHHIPVLNEAFNSMLLERFHKTSREVVMLCVFGSFILLSISFLISAFYYKAEALYRRITASSRFRYLNSVLMYMTKYTDTGAVSKSRSGGGVSNTAFAAPPHVSPDVTSRAARPKPGQRHFT